MERCLKESVSALIGRLSGQAAEFDYAGAQHYAASLENREDELELVDIAGGV